MDALLIWLWLVMVSGIINTAGIRIASAIRDASAIRKLKTADDEAWKDGTP